MGSGSDSKLYRPGQVVPTAGIYKVLHRGHRDPHEASLRADETFPSCRKCGDQVRFQLVFPIRAKAQKA